jgi:hypothetical protein
MITWSRSVKPPRAALRATGLFVLATLVSVAPLFSPPAVAVTPAVHAVAGDYTLFLKCGPHHCDPRGWQDQGDLTLTSNGQGTASYEQSNVTWNASKRQFSMYLYDMMYNATFNGVLTKQGINSAAHPGTFGGDENSGIWYATLDT